MKLKLGLLAVLLSAVAFGAETEKKSYFQDLTKSAGVDVPHTNRSFKNPYAHIMEGYTALGASAAAADYNNDGFEDLFVTDSKEGSPNHLYRNNGDGTFTDVTAEAAVAGDQGAWSTSASFFDMDNDGDLDLFVCNYVQWSRQIDLDVNFQLTGIGRAYGPPNAYQGTWNYLYRNDGDGRFTDVSASAGIRVDNPATGAPMGKALAVVGPWGDATMRDRLTADIAQLQDAQAHD